MGKNVTNPLYRYSVVTMWYVMMFRRGNILTLVTKNPAVMEFLSIIIPAYNAEQWLERCLKSVLKAADADCEVIVVNDGSTDGTARIARAIADTDPRFTVITTPHQGPCASRKAGFLESTGDYIVFVDSDDVLPEKAIADQRKLLSSGEAYGDTEKPLIVVGNTVARINNSDTHLISGERRLITGADYAMEILTAKIPGFLPGHFYHRSLLEAIEWSDDPAIMHHDHQYLTLSMAMKLNEWDPQARRVLLDPSVICYRYMRRPGSQSAMMPLAPVGLSIIWKHLSALPLPEPQFTLWGLDIIRHWFIDRGIPFNNNFGMARDLHRRVEAINGNLPANYRDIAECLTSTKKRMRIAREQARTGRPTTIAPHLSLIVVSHKDVSKVNRTLKCIFNTGLRNLEVVLVDHDNSYSDSVTLNSMVIRYPRVRLAKSSGQGFLSAVRSGLAIVTGLCVTFVQPGDRITPEGIYDAVARIDAGADVVLVNHRRYNPYTRLRSRTHSYAYLRGNNGNIETDSTGINVTENVRQAVIDEVKTGKHKPQDFTSYGIIWRRSALVNTGVEPEDYDHLSRFNLSTSALPHLLERPLRVVTQDNNTPAAYEFAADTLFRHAVARPFSFMLI